MSLTDLAARHMSDKGTLWFERHGYTAVYDEILAPLRHEPFKLLEIGLRHDPFYFRPPKYSPSLEMWSRYFQRAWIFGFDIVDLTHLSRARVRILQGDQGDPRDLQRVAEQGPFRVVIDDGSHASYHQQLSLTTLLPHVEPGGYYIVEDLHYQPASLEERLPPATKTSSYLRSEGFRSGPGSELSSIRFWCGDRLAVLRK